jgi:hypothetical protein
MLPSSTNYSYFPFRSHDDPVIFTLYSTTFNDMNSDQDFNNDRDFIKWVKNNNDFSEMIENMFDWNVMGTLSDGGRVFYIKENMKEEEEMMEYEVREENKHYINHNNYENHVNIFENLSNEEITVEEEEVIEMSGVSLYEGCYDIETKFIEEGYVNCGVSGGNLIIYT